MSSELGSLVLGACLLLSAGTARAWSTPEPSPEPALAADYVKRYGFEFTIPITPARYFGGAWRAAAAQAENRDTVTIEIHNLKFTPEVIEISPGTRVRWVNQDPLEHSSTAPGQWNSGLIKANGGSYERVFTTPGEYAYACTPHPFMKGRVVVRAGAAP